MFQSMKHNHARSVLRFLALVTTLLILLLSLSMVSAQLGAGSSPGNPPAGNPPAGAPPAGSPGDAAGGSGSNTVTVADCGATTIDGESGDTTNGLTYASSSDDQSALCIINGGGLTANDAVVTKTGETSSSDESSFYGLNAAVLVGAGSSLAMNGGTVTTNGSGTNGVFSTG
ncbi:MAG: hypothetical protein U0452_14895, partial [Anaerolineae bacterium]